MCVKTLGRLHWPSLDQLFIDGLSSRLHCWKSPSSCFSFCPPEETSLMEQPSFLLWKLMTCYSITKKEKLWNFSRCKTVTSPSYYCSLGVNTKGAIRKWKPKEPNWSVSIVFPQYSCHRCHISIFKGLRKQIHPIERFTQLRAEKTDGASLVFWAVFQGDMCNDAKLL